MEKNRDRSGLAVLIFSSGQEIVVTKGRLEVFTSI